MTPRMGELIFSPVVDASKVVSLISPPAPFRLELNCSHEK